MMMFIKGHAHWFLFGILVTSHTHAADLQGSNTAVLSVQPDSCIALHQGQECYQAVDFSWQLVVPGEYCLYKAGNDKPLTCWQYQQKNTFYYEFESDSSTVFQIRRQDNLIAETRVRVAWVYKSKRKNAGSWRLF